MELEWVKKGSEERGVTGKYIAFNVYYDGFTSKSSCKKIKLICYLHGIKPELGHYKNEDDAKRMAEKAFKLWLDGCNKNDN